MDKTHFGFNKRTGKNRSTEPNNSLIGWQTSGKRDKGYGIIGGPGQPSDKKKRKGLIMGIYRGQAIESMWRSRRRKIKSAIRYWRSWQQGLCLVMQTHPSRDRLMRFLSEVCRRLPSDSTSPWTPLPSANGYCCLHRSGLSPYRTCPCRARIRSTSSTDVDPFLCFDKKTPEILFIKREPFYKGSKDGGFRPRMCKKDIHRLGISLKMDGILASQAFTSPRTPRVAAIPMITQAHICL